MLGSLGGGELLFALLLWCVPLVLLVWFVRTLSSIAAALRDMVARLATLEEAVRSSSTTRAPNGQL